MPFMPFRFLTSLKRHYSPSPFRALASRRYSNKHHHHQSSAINRLQHVLDGMRDVFSHAGFSFQHFSRVPRIRANRLELELVQE